MWGRSWHWLFYWPPNPRFPLTALHWFPSVITATMAIPPHLVKPHLHDCLQATDSHPGFHRAFGISSVTAHPKLLTAAAKGQFTLCQPPGHFWHEEARCLQSHCSPSLPAVFPVSARFGKCRNLQDVYFPASLMSTKAWATLSAPSKGKAGRSPHPFLALPQPSAPESCPSEAPLELSGGGRRRAKDTNA